MKETKTLKQTCAECKEEFLTVMESCAICYLKNHKHLVIEKKTKWQLWKQFSWEIILIIAPVFFIASYFGLRMEICFILGFNYGLIFKFVVEKINRWF